MYSNPIEGDLHGSMNCLIVLGDRLDVGIPTVLSPHLLDSFPLVIHAAGEGLVAHLSE